MMLVLQSLGIFVGVLALIGAACMVEIRLRRSRGFGNTEQA